MGREEEGAKNEEVMVRCIWAVLRPAPSFGLKGKFEGAFLVVGGGGGWPVILEVMVPVVVGGIEGISGGRSRD